jgi:TRAP-type C4-dicarboxylate transport system permease small subunit
MSALAAGGRAVASAYAMVNRVFVALTYVALLAMMTVTAVSALSRYLLNAPLGGVEELIDEFFMPTLVYLAAAHIYDTGGLIRITLLVDHFPPWLKKLSTWIGDVGGTLFFALVTWGVAVRMFEAYSMREYSSSPLNYLIAHSYLIVAAGAALLMLRMLASVVTGRHPHQPDMHVG